MRRRSYTHTMRGGHLRFRNIQTTTVGLRQILLECFLWQAAPLRVDLAKKIKGFPVRVLAAFRGQWTATAPPRSFNSNLILVYVVGLMPTTFIAFQHHYCVRVHGLMVCFHLTQPIMGRSSFIDALFRTGLGTRHLVAA